MIVETVIVIGAIAGGFVSGLTGFGTGLTVLAFWILVVSPGEAAPLVVICAVAAQIRTLPAIWRKIDWGRIWPFLIGGVLGVPLGTSLLLQASPAAFKTVLGVLLIG